MELPRAVWVLDNKFISLILSLTLSTCDTRNSKRKGDEAEIYYLTYCKRWHTNFVEFKGSVKKSPDLCNYSATKTQRPEEEMNIN